MVKKENLEHKIKNWFVKGFASGLIVLGGLGFINNAKADILDFVDPNSVKIVAQADNGIGKSTICENWISWEQGGGIYVKNRTSGVQTLVNSNAYNPNLDSVSGNKLVYDKEDSIHIYNLSNMSDLVVYQSTGTEITSNPKINGDNLVFRLYFDIEEAQIGQIIGYNLPSESFYPITNSLNKKTQPDIFGRYVIWTEEEENIVYPGKMKYSNKLYDLQLGQEITMAENVVSENINSSAVYGSIVAGVASSMSWDNGPSSLVLHDLSYYEQNDNPRRGCISTGIVYSYGGRKDNCALYENLMVWENIMSGKIFGVDLNSSVSIDQFYIGDGHNPDVYVDSNGNYNVIYMTDSGPVVENSGFGASSFDSNENYLIATKIISYPGPSKCGERGTDYLTGDLNHDCYVDIGDLELITNNWLKEGLGMDRPIDGNDLNLNPNNWSYVCDVGPEIMIQDKRVYLDFNGDCKVDLEDYSIFAQDWLKCTDPENHECDAYWEYKRNSLSH